MHRNNIDYFGTRTPIEEILKCAKAASYNLENTVFQLIIMQIFVISKCSLFYVGTSYFPVNVLLYPRNFGEGRWGVSWMLIHRNRVRIGCEGCLKQTRCTRFQAL
jgi:hypothetical protein